MRLIKNDTTIDFLGKRKMAFVLSAILILGSFISLIAHGGPNYGIDFRGGEIVQLKFVKEEPVANIRKVISKLGIGDFNIQEFGSKNDFLVRVAQAPSAGEEDARSQIVQDGLHDVYGDGFTVERVEMVGPKVGSDLREKAFLALFYSLAGILLYITLRFELRFGVAAIVALAHDTILTIGAFSIFNMEITLTVVAAVLTVIGYSLNDTIVVFDRIRENFKLKRGLSIEELMNISINQTLSRTILTSCTTLFVVLSIFFLGGEVIHAFAFALLIGVCVGTYSSIFVAAPVLLLWDAKKGAGAVAGNRKRNKKAKT